MLVLAIGGSLNLVLALGLCPPKQPHEDAGLELLLLLLVRLVPVVKVDEADRVAVQPAADVARLDVAVQNTRRM